MAENLSGRLDQLEKSIKRAAETIARLKAERDALAARVTALEADRGELATLRQERRDVLAQVVAGEAEVARLLGHVNLHDSAEERMDLPPAPQQRALHVIDRVLAAQHEDEEQLREGSPEADHLSRAEPEQTRHARHVEPGDPIFYGVAGGEDEDGRLVAGGAQPAQHGEAAEPW